MKLEPLIRHRPPPREVVKHTVLGLLGFAKVLALMGQAITLNVIDFFSKFEIK